MRNIESNQLGINESNPLRKSVSNQLTSFEDHLDELYGIRGTQTREAFEEEFETFKIGLLF